MWLSQLCGVLAATQLVSASLSKTSAKEALKHGSASRTLASFQKYTDKLVEDYLKGGQDPSANSELQDAVDMIYEFFDELYAQHVVDHGIDKAVGSQCTSNVVACQTNHFDESVESSLTQAAVDVDEAKANFTSCRDTEQECCSKQFGLCSAYKTHRKYERHYPPPQGALIPSCAVPNGKLDDAHIKASHSTQESMLAAMEECLEQMKAWLDGTVQPPKKGIYPLMQECRQAEDCCEHPGMHMDPPYEAGESDPKCCNLQNRYENDVCQQEQGRETHCGEFNSCTQREIDKCEPACNEVEIGVKARKADNESMSRIKCLLDVLLNTEESQKESKLNACNAGPYDTSWWNIEDCPPEDFPPEVHESAHCQGPVPDHVPCQPAFISSYINQWTHYHKPGYCQCVHCSVVGQYGGVVPP